jgi:hypothetical protein
MTRPIGAVPVHATPTTTPSRQTTRQTKPSEDSAFAHQLLTALQPRAATSTAPTPRRAPIQSTKPETEEPGDEEGSNDNSRPTPSGGDSPAAHTSTAPGAQSGTPTQSTTVSTPHAGPSATDSAVAVDGSITGLAGWIAMRAELDAHEADFDAGHIASSETKSSQSPSLTQAQSSSDRSGSVAPAMSRSSRDANPTEPVRGTAHGASDSSAPDTQEMEPSDTPPAGASVSASTQASEATPMPAGVTVLALSSASPDAAAAPSARDHDGSASAADSTIDNAVAGVLMATSATSDAAASQSAAPGTDGAAQATGPDVASAVAADAIASAPSDRITVQFPTDQGSARIQIAVSNGTVVTRIMMPDAASATHLSAATSDLHDALVRQGFDAVKIAVPAPPSSGLPSLGHSAEQSPNRTPDRAPQQSFTSAQDHRTPGRSQQRPRRQRER